MSTYINNIVEEDTITCTVCNCTFETNEITTDDFNFAWDNIFSVDCCSNCSSELSKWKYIVWVGGVDDYYTTYERAKVHYDEWIAKGYNDVILEKIKENT